MMDEVTAARWFARSQDAAGPEREGVQHETI